MATRKRLPHAESRQLALDAARAVLLESGPEAVTLKAIAGRIGRTHANLLHHFGSAAGLQQALTQHLVTEVCDSIARAVEAGRETGDGSTREVVDMIFDAFDRGGGALASWLLLSGNKAALNVIVAEICKLIDKFEDYPFARETGLALVLMALGDAQLGPMLTESLKLTRDMPRQAANFLLRTGIEAHENRTLRGTGHWPPESDQAGSSQ